MDTSCIVPHSLLVPGIAGSPNYRPAAHSYFDRPIEEYAGRLRGNSRRWGDADLQTQREVVNAVMEEAAARGLNETETAFVIALIRTESGFNPDAAAISSSAAGLGQFIKQTAAAYGIHDENRFSVRKQIRSVITHLQDLARAYLPRASGRPEEFAKLYALYHDGPSLNHGGLAVAQKTVLPWMNRIRDWLSLC